MSEKEFFINRINDYLNKVENLNADTFIQEAKNNNAAKRQSDIDTYSGGMDSQITNTQNYYNKQIGDTKVQYESDYERNAVQKLINEKMIAEKNVNLGLHDSGLNRTQQSAVQLSYANQKGDIDLAKQSVLDELNMRLTDAVTTLQNEKASGIREIENSWDTYSTEQGTNAYNSKLQYYNDLIKSDTEALAAIEQAEIEAQAEIVKKQIEENARLEKKQIEENARLEKERYDTYTNRSTVSYGNGGTQNGNYILRTNNGLLSRDFYGSLKDNGVDTVYNYDKNGKAVSVTYTDNNSGKQTTIAYGKNPYTGHDNINGGSDAAKAVRSYGAYSNGYQPKGVYKNGVDYGKMVASVDKTNPEQTFGIAFNIFKTTKNGTHYWVWDATINNYVEVVQARNNKGKTVWSWKE